jgi:hypothetical protein
MTFTEAALEVLRSAGEPLHYKKITELAIARNLLSHVGKTPEVTMSSRLATLVKKDRGQSGIVKVRPGVFAVRESQMPSENESQPTAESSPELDQPVPESVSVVARPARPPLPGADVFPEEEGDDDPILAGVGADEGGSQDERGRRRRRRRRRGKGGEGDEVSVEARPAVRPEESGPRPAGRPERERDRDRDRSGRGSGRDERGRDNRSGRDERGRDDRPRDDRGRDSRGGRDERGRDERGRDERGRDHGPREERVELDLSRQPADGDLLGKDLADAAYSVLARGERVPVGFARVADQLVRRGRLTGSPDALASTVAAALRADAARAHRSHTRPRFRLVDQRVSLTEWLLPRDVVRCEENVENAAEQQRDQVRRAFVNRLNDLPTAGFAELIATWLNAEGLTALRAIRRPGSSGRELHLAGTLRRGAEETRLAIVVLRSGRDVERDAVVEVRGSMHHYGGATSAWLVTTARVSPGGREEAAADHAAPCALLSGQDLARSMERLGIGLRQYQVPLCDIDFDLLEALGDAGLRRERNMREEPRPRRDDGPREQRESREPREQREQAAGNAAADGEGAAQKPFELLDAEAAEASRLPAAARGSWNEEDESEEGEAATAQLEAVDGEEAEGEEAEAAAEGEGEELDFDRDRDEPLAELDEDADDDDDESADDEEEAEEGEGADEGDESDESEDGDENGDENGDDENEEEED